MFKKLMYFVSAFMVVCWISLVTAQEVDMEIGYAIQTPVIDGEVDDIWAGASTQYFVPLDDPNNASGIWKALYDAENLYVLVDITDDILQNDSASSWQDDSVEIYFDGGNTKLSTPLSGDDHQYTFGWTTDEIQGTNIAGYTDGIEHAQVTTDTGWRIEVKMPWISIWGIIPQAGDLIGIDVYYNDDDDGGDSREGKMLSFSAIEGWNDASQWGTAVLAAIPKAKNPIPADGASGLSPKPPLSTYISSDVPMIIPDQIGWYPTPISSSLTIADSLKITDLNVELDISHSKNNADLDVYLIGPDGTQVELFTDVGLWEKNFKNTILDDEAGKSITSGSGPFTGIFKPEGKLSAFDGKNTQGTWKLKIQDDWSSGTGILNSWRLVIESPIIMSWSPTDYNASQDLYISNNFDDVNDSNSTAYQGNLAADTASIEIALDIGQTYYWRIDSLDINDLLIATGDIWSFSTMDANATAAGNPDPSNGAIDVGQNTILKWSHGVSAVSSDVYFGTDGSPAFKTTTTGTSFDVGKLATSMTYYWQIDETDADGTIHIGEVWSFTTVIGEATKPNPADLASDVPVDAILSWKAGATAASYDVYFGTTDSPEYMGNQSETSFNPGGLEYATMYYWQVDAIEADGTIHVGTLWSFMTPSGQAKDPNPADGTTLYATSAKLSWTAGDGAALHDVYLGTDLNALKYLDSQTETDITIKGLTSGTTYYWRIVEVEGDGITVHESPVWSFTIPPETAYDPIPSNGEELASDAVVILSWKAGLNADAHLVYFSDDPNALTDVASATQGSDTSFDPGLLEAGKTYYWRIDEFNPLNPLDTVTGEVWSFSLAVPAPEPEPEPEPEPLPEPNLLDLVVQLNTEGDLAGTLDTFIAAVLTAELADGLATEDNLTVFAPTDDAFAKLELTAENIGRLDLAFLTNMLLYHATDVRLLAADVLAVDHLEMLNGGNVNQFVGVLTDNLGRKAQITVTDLEASNGMIHMINGVLLPDVLPELGPEPEPEPEPEPAP